jgi:hypothetical protein
MRKILLTLAATAAVAVTAAPAAAQNWRGDYGRGGHAEGQRFTGRYDALEWQLRNAANEGRISRGESRELLNMWRINQPLAWRVETGRASQREHQRVMTTMTRIERALDRSQRFSRYDRDDRRGDWRR